MLKGKEKEECIENLIYQYIAEQNNNRLNCRNVSASYLMAKGKLLGFCMAHEWQLLESENLLQIRSKNQKMVFEKRKD